MARQPVRGHGLVPARAQPSASGLPTPLRWWPGVGLKSSVIVGRVGRVGTPEAATCPIGGAQTGHPLDQEHDGGCRQDHEADLKGGTETHQGVEECADQGHDRGRHHEEPLIDSPAPQNDDAGHPVGSRK